MVCLYQGDPGLSSTGGIRDGQAAGSLTGLSPVYSKSASLSNINALTSTILGFTRSGNLPDQQHTMHHEWRLEIREVGVKEHMFIGGGMLRRPIHKVGPRRLDQRGISQQIASRQGQHFGGGEGVVMG
jgi:hypothetical protein